MLMIIQLQKIGNDLDIFCSKKTHNCSEKDYLVIENVTFYF